MKLQGWPKKYIWVLFLEAPLTRVTTGYHPTAHQQVLTAHYYLDDMFEALGPTRFVRRSQLAGRRPGDPARQD